MDLSQLLSAKLLDVRERFAWYENLAGVPIPDRMNVEQLPLMTASVLEQYYYRQPPPDASELAAYRTSGTSSGRRKTIYYSERDDEHYIEIKTKLFGAWLGASEGRRAMADMGTGHAASTALTIFRRLGLEAEALSFELPIERHLERLSSFRPHILYTMPSILEQIVHASAEPSQYGIRNIILVGEIAPLEWQRRMARQFGLTERDILDTYGSIEIGTIAVYSHDLGKYVLAEGLYAEGIGTDQLTEAWEPLLPNERVLVLTSFVRSAFPALRFVTYDVVRDLETVAIDGVPRQCFRCISKRIGPELKHGEKISLYDIEDVIFGFVDEAEVKVQVVDNVLHVFLKSKSLDDRVLPRIREAMEQKIADIGTMIRNGLLRSIEVQAVKEGESFVRGAVKKKRIYYEGRQ